ncbi:MAG TPA: FtsQ-type POTRA domain-containing protein [Patescibacteria group bacterium]|nr:FtsQ-type POTRA domain-containing protein [Patescibacteria group bacterium]
MKRPRVPVPERSPDAVLGRAMRGLVDPAKDDGRRTVGSGRQLPVPSAARRTGGAVARPARRGRIRIFAPARAAGLLGMLASGFLYTLVTGPTAFGLTRTELPNLTWTDEAAVAAKLDVPAGSNIFRLDTAPLEAAIRTLPGVADAGVSVTLPDAALIVRIDERVPVLAWQVGTRRFIADASGAIFAIVDAGVDLPAGVAVVDDRRQDADAALWIGAHLDSVDLDVATRLGSLTPADVGSAAPRLRVVVTDDDGFELVAAGGWLAVFGFYSPSTRSTDMVPGQVRLLRSLLAGREDSVRRVILASDTDGTYISRETPRPSTR